MLDLQNHLGPDHSYGLTTRVTAAVTTPPRPHTRFQHVSARHTREECESLVHVNDRHELWLLLPVYSRRVPWGHLQWWQPNVTACMREREEDRLSPRLPRGSQ